MLNVKVGTKHLLEKSNVTQMVTCLSATALCVIILLHYLAYLIHSVHFCHCNDCNDDFHFTAQSKITFIRNEILTKTGPVVRVVLAMAAVV